MKDLISYFPRPNAIHLQKRYLIRELYKPCGTKIRNFICHIDEMAEHLDKIPPFGAGQHLP